MTNKIWYSDRIEKLLLVFNLIMLIKSISAGYTASYLSLNDPKLLEQYMNKFQIAPLFFFASFALMSIPLFFKGNSVRKWCDWVAVGVIALGILYIYDPINLFK